MRRFARTPAWYLTAIAVGGFVLVPIVIYFVQAFADGAAGFKAMMALPNLAQIIVNTLVIALGSTLVATIAAIALAKAVLHIPRRLQGLATFIPLLPLVAPPIAIVIGWVFLFSPTVGYANVLLRSLPWLSDMAEGPIDIYTLPAIIIVTGFDMTGIVFLLVSARLMEIRGPLEAAARLAGASATKSFLTITLPLLKPSVIAGAVLVFLMGLGQFTAPLLLGSRQGIDVVTTTIFFMRESFPIPYATTAALGFPLLLLGAGAVLLQRRIIGDQRKYVTQTGAGGGAAEKSSVWAFIVVATYALFAVVLPFAAIVLVAFSPYWSGDLSSIDFTLSHFATTMANAGVWDSVATTLVTSLIAVAIALPIGFIAALATTGPFRAPRLAQMMFEFAFQSPLAIPRAILGMAILFVFLRPPFSMYGTIWLFVIGYVFVILPFMLRAQQGSLVGLSPSLFESARVSGASSVRAVFDIALPLVRRGMASGATLGLMLLSHDFAVSVMVRSPGKHVMGTKLYEFWENGVYPEVAVMSVIMTAVTGVILAASLWAGGRSALKNL
ncbi:ABC transporter permease [Homoserinimonas sp. A447]